MDGFTKLFGRIVHSTIWQEDHPTRVLWVTMLAMADQDGIVHATVPGLANAARITLGECERALRKFQQPDPYSRTKAEEGRRVREIEGGWWLINHGTYRALMSAEEQKEKARLRQQKKRMKDRACHATVTECHAPVTLRHGCHDIAEAEAEAEAIKPKPADGIDAQQATTGLFMELGMAGDRARMLCYDAIKAYMHKRQCSPAEAFKGLLSLWKDYQAAEFDFKCRSPQSWLEKGEWARAETWNGNHRESAAVIDHNRCDVCDGAGRIHQKPDVPGPRLIPCPKCSLVTK